MRAGICPKGEAMSDDYNKKDNDAFDPDNNKLSKRPVFHTDLNAVAEVEEEIQKEQSDRIASVLGMTEEEVLDEIMSSHYPSFHISRYHISEAEDPNNRLCLAIQLRDIGLEIDLTRIFPDAPTPREHQAYVDTKRLPNAEKFIRRYKLGSPVVGLDYNNKDHAYPLYEFREIPIRGRKRALDGLNRTYKGLSR